MKRIFVLSIDGSFDLASGATNGWVADAETSITHSFHSVAELLERLKDLYGRQARLEGD